MICRLATSVSCEQAPEDPGADFERLRDSRARAFRRRIRVSPCFQMLFRPEEGERRSEAIDRLTSIIATHAKPDHHAFGVRPRPVKRDREAEGGAAVMALRPDLDGFSHHRGHPERIRRTAGVALAVT